MRQPRFRYQSVDEDSGRWTDFPFRDGDIVISTRSKSGTTWMQMICALLVFQTPDLPAPMASLSPWLDWLIEDQAAVFAGLAAQQHRRFIKTHTPLDGIPIRPEATYIVVGRHPLDMTISLYHQGNNLDRELMRQMSGQPEPEVPRPSRPPLHEWLVDWIEQEADPRADLESLPGVLHHLSDAWARRDEPNVILVHYDDLSADLDGEMRRLAERLGFHVPSDIWATLVDAATFSQMRDRARLTSPGPDGILLDRAAFFRRGTSGAAREILTADEIARYHEQTASMAPPDMLAWLHRQANSTD
ncbi:MAG: sulfotransferase domain-containing protein [Chloroflexi bacterium]|nr:sulfotransferase domain-containing protein [Chloroflexota bacterium]